MGRIRANQSPLPRSSPVSPIHSSLHTQLAAAPVPEGEERTAEAGSRARWLAVGRFQAGLQEVVVRASSGISVHPLCIPGPQPWLPPTDFEACHCPAGPWPPTPLIAILTGPFYLPSPLPIPSPALQQGAQHPVLASRNLVAQPLCAGVSIPAFPSPHPRTHCLPRYGLQSSGT